MSIKLKHYNELDGVRAIAVIMVMFYHFFKDVDVHHDMLILVKKMSLFGKTGVSLFFVLSGFLITRILLNTKKNDSYFKSFYIKRVLRIFPLYYFFLMIYYFVVPCFLNQSFADFSQQIWYWTFMQNFALTFDWNNVGPIHYWSLSVEEHFYLFWPLIIYYCSLKNIKWAILSLCVISFVVRFILIENHIEESLFTFARFDELAIGSFLAILELEKKLVTENLRKFITVFIIFLIPLIYISLNNGNYSLLESCARYLVLAMVYGSFVAIAIVIEPNNFLKKALDSSALKSIGKISFGLYVYHPICFDIVINYLKITNLGFTLLLSFGLAYLVSILSYNLLEKKFLMLKSQFSH